MTPAKVEQPQQPTPHVAAKPVRWIWEVRRYMNRHQGAYFEFGATPVQHLRYFIDARVLWPKDEIITYFNNARKAGDNQ